MVCSSSDALVVGCLSPLVGVAGGLIGELLAASVGALLLIWLALDRCPALAAADNITG
jgi:hypothetical protein